MADQKKTLLIVDDDPDLCKLLADVFAEAGYRTVTLSEGSASECVVPERPPDVAIVDFMLPGYAGLLALWAIKQAAGTDTPVVMTAGHIEYPDLAAARAFGADDFLVLPYEIDDLVTAVSRLCPPQANKAT